MNKPLISIIIPAYNASNYLSQAIDSALAQTYPHIEVIVVNDGSNDDGATKDVALSYGDKILYYEKPNGGCASTLNFGIRVMHGEWFSWLSHDDLYLPERTQALIDAIGTNALTPSQTVLACDALLMKADGTKVFSPFRQTRGLLSPQAAFEETLLTQTFNGCGLLIPRKVLECVGDFLPEYKHLLDREMWMRIAMAGVSYFVIEPALVINRVHAKQITVEQQSLLYDEEEKLVKSYLTRALAPEANPNYVKSLCYFCYKRRHYILGKQIYDSAKCAGKMKIIDLVKAKKFQLSGVIRRPIGKIYKKMIRISRSKQK